MPSPPDEINVRLTVRPSILLCRLSYSVPRLNAASLTLRLAQTIAIVALSLSYALSHPPIYHDVLVWPKHAPAGLPYEVRVYRNTTASYALQVPLQDVPGLDLHLASGGTFIRNKHPTERLCRKLVCDARICEDGRYGCTEERDWAAHRIGWLDSEGFDPHPWISGVAYIDRYIFFLMIGAGFVALGHNLSIFCHATEPSDGLYFFKYTTVMDFLLSSAFLCLGVFPMAIERDYEDVPYSTLSLSTLNGTEAAMITERDSALKRACALSGRLTRSQTLAFCMGWVCWGLYLATFVVNVVLISSLLRYRPKKEERSEEAEEGTTIEMEMEMEDWSGLTLLGETGVAGPKGLEGLASDVVGESSGFCATMRGKRKGVSRVGTARAH